MSRSIISWTKRFTPALQRRSAALGSYSEWFAHSGYISDRMACNQLGSAAAALCRGATARKGCGRTAGTRKSAASKSNQLQQLFLLAGGVPQL